MKEKKEEEKLRMIGAKNKIMFAFSYTSIQEKQNKVRILKKVEKTFKKVEKRC